MKSNFIKFIVLCTLLLLITETTKYLLNFNKLLFNSLLQQLTESQTRAFFKLQDKWKFVGYTFVPVYIALKTCIISSVLYIGTFFYSKTKITFKQLLNIVLKAEFIFLLIPILKIIWFYFIQTNYTLEDLQYFYPLSALNIVGYKNIDAWFIYPLQTLNLFEVAYWLFLAYYIGKLASPSVAGVQNKYPIDFGLKIVASSYGSALLLWVVLIMFVTLNYS